MILFGWGVVRWVPFHYKSLFGQTGRYRTHVRLMQPWLKSILLGQYLHIQKFAQTIPRPFARIPKLE